VKRSISVRHKKLSPSYQGRNRTALWIDCGLRPREIVRKNHRRGPHIAVAVLCKSKALRKRFKERMCHQDGIYYVRETECGMMALTNS